MRRRFVHLGLNPMGTLGDAGREPPHFHKLLQRFLDEVDGAGGDWFRFGSQNYVVWTSLSLDELAKGIHELEGFGSVYVLATEMLDTRTTACNGWMSSKFWDWLRKARV